ncbi:polymorphic toxin type 33 domain-containing protein [Vibrio vulnificus]|uniref:polymorphic toxin type 33 domain-containing protein n=1 Tax=Vibrio vulnificus TaxID=672 RepID=UPI001F504BAF|nr:polymorphic toxin type 33 domain-containing protein [Vibrio vulnificus]
MPNFGRWLNRDPLQEQGGINLYAYVNGDPLGYVDPDGRFAVVMFHPAVAIPVSYAVCRALGGCEIPNLPDWPSWQNSESVPESCADDKKLSKGEIDKLKGHGIDPHDLKPKKNGSKYDLFKDRDGNIFVKPKKGNGPGEFTGFNIYNL